MDLFRMFSRLDQKGKLKLWKKIKADCEAYPDKLVKVPFDFAIPYGPRSPKEAWRSKNYVVEIYDVNENWERLAIHRMAFNTHYDNFIDGISWRKIQDIKAECGRGSCEAVEIYPSEGEEIGGLSLRHIWVRKNGSFMTEEGIGWKQEQTAARPVALSSIDSFQATKNSAQKDATSEGINVLLGIVNPAV